MKQCILLIEDDEAFYDSVCLILASHDIEVVWAENGTKGIQTFRQNPHGFSIVMIDYKLKDVAGGPDLNGGDVCRHLKKINPDQIFLFTSKYFEKDYLTDQLRAGSAGFVDKTEGAQRDPK